MTHIHLAVPESRESMTVTGMDHHHVCVGSLYLIYSLHLNFLETLLLIIIIIYSYLTTTLVKSSLYTGLQLHAGFEMAGESANQHGRNAMKINNSFVNSKKSLLGNVCVCLYQSEDALAQECCKHLMALVSA